MKVCGSTAVDTLALPLARLNGHQNVNRPRNDEAFRLRPICCHMRCRTVCPERFRARPFFHDDKGVGPEWSRKSAELRVDDRRIFEAARLGPHRGDVRGKSLEQGGALTRNRSDDRYDVKHA